MIQIGDTTYPAEEKVKRRNVPNPKYSDPKFVSDKRPDVQENDSVAWRKFDTWLKGELKGVKLTDIGKVELKKQFESDETHPYTDMDHFVQGLKKEGMIVDQAKFVAGLGPSAEMGKRPGWTPQARAVPIEDGENRRHVISASTLGRAIQKSGGDMESINAFLKDWNGEEASSESVARINAWKVINSNPNNLWPGEGANNKAAGFIRAPLKLTRDELMKEPGAIVTPERLQEIKDELNKPHGLAGRKIEGHSEASGTERWHEMSRVSGALLDSLVEQKYFEQLKENGGPEAVGAAKQEAKEYRQWLRPPAMMIDDGEEVEPPALSELERIRGNKPLQVERNPQVEVDMDVEVQGPTPAQLERDWPVIKNEDLAKLLYELELNADLDLPDQMEVSQTEQPGIRERDPVQMTPGYYKELTDIYAEIRKTAESHGPEGNPDLFAEGGVFRRYMELNLRNMQQLDNPSVAADDEGYDAGEDDDMGLRGEEPDGFDEGTPDLDGDQMQEEGQNQDQGYGGPDGANQPMQDEGEEQQRRVPKRGRNALTDSDSDQNELQDEPNVDNPQKRQKLKEDEEPALQAGQLAQGGVTPPQAAEKSVRAIYASKPKPRGEIIAGSTADVMGMAAQNDQEGENLVRKKGVIVRQN